jgi:MFS family permease
LSVAKPGVLARLPPTIWALGTVSLFMDASSELVHSVLPLFLSLSLGASMAIIGLIEGSAEAIAQIAKLVSGVLSDRSMQRKPWIAAGYGLAALTKPLFPLAMGIAPVAAARFLDRVGKGIRGAPRDALVADVTAPELRGAAFGLRQAMDTVGAIIGPASAAVLLLIYADNVRAVLWWAVLPAALSFATLIIWVREPARPAARSGLRPSLRAAGSLPGRFWLITGIACLMTGARFSEAFLILRGGSAGLTLAAAPLVLVLMNLVYALSSYPAGAASDRLGRRGLLAAGIVALLLADLVLAFADTRLMLGVGVALWGLHMGLTQGLLSAMVADAAPVTLRGSAFGVFYAATGIALLAGSATAGLLWDSFGPTVPFLTAAIISGITLLLLPLAHSGREGAGVGASPRSKGNRS